MCIRFRLCTLRPWTLIGFTKIAHLFITGEPELFVPLGCPDVTEVMKLQRCDHSRYVDFSGITRSWISANTMDSRITAADGSQKDSHASQVCIFPLCAGLRHKVIANWRTLLYAIQYLMAQWLCHVLDSTVLFFLRYFQELGVQTLRPIADSQHS